MYLMLYAKTFLTVYRLGSVTAAATQLSITQPAASGHLKVLEASLQKKLFVKAGRGISPTESAHALAQSLAPYIDGLEHALTVMRMNFQDLVGNVTLGGPVEFLSQALLPSIAKITDSQLRLSVVFGLSDQLTEQLKKNELDLAVLTVRPPQTAFESIPLYIEEFTLVAAPRLAARIDLTKLAAGNTEEIESTPWVAYNDKLPLIRRFWKKEFLTDPSFRPNAVVPDLRALRTLVIAGAGLTVLPRYLIGDDLIAGSLVEIYRSQNASTNRLYLSWVRGGLRSPKLLHFKDLISNAAKVL
jgi:DNA-binding transcriptional LysR family regulator